eukprot:CAMPEP_0173258820 /NCGR_PEP_ID=MMETSP1142-20121109/24604_1 /TAXON_ID=483371 /ORGANISM="non described non described, Strain CCMP2298" /LENGTH=106 /DNA_ID=CAMNT_0014193235 /DNA_START=125 /DNA_END=445 /DNA_ORIENTATION=-
MASKFIFMARFTRRTLHMVGSSLEREYSTKECCRARPKAPYSSAPIPSALYARAKLSTLLGNLAVALDTINSSAIRFTTNFDLNDIVLFSSGLLGRIAATWDMNES